MGSAWRLTCRRKGPCNGSRSAPVSRRSAPSLAPWMVRDQGSTVWRLQVHSGRPHEGGKGPVAEVPRWQEEEEGRCGTERVQARCVARIGCGGLHCMTVGVRVLCSAPISGAILAMGQGMHSPLQSLVETGCRLSGAGCVCSCAAAIACRWEWAAAFGGVLRPDVWQGCAWQGHASEPSGRHLRVLMDGNAQLLVIFAPDYTAPGPGPHILEQVALSIPVPMSMWTHLLLTQR